MKCLQGSPLNAGMVVLHTCHGVYICLAALDLAQQQLQLCHPDVKTQCLQWKETVSVLHSTVEALAHLQPVGIA